MTEAQDKIQYVGAVDQGTTSTRFMIFDHGGEEVARHQLEHEQVMPQAGWVEHDPVEIWERTRSVIQKAMGKAGLQADDLCAVGITNQRETTVVWNRKTGRPYYNAIVWQDTRTDKIASKLERDGHGDLIRHRAGLPPATYFAGGKIQWILENVDGVREAAEAGDAIFGTTDSWLIWNLTGGTDGGVHVTDVTNASRTMLMDLETCEWDDELLGLFDIPRQMLPEIRSSSEPEGYGTTRRDGPFGGEVALTGILGDQQAATVGQVCFEPGEAKNTYGTGNFMLLNTGTELIRSEHGLLTTVCYRFGKDEPVYALEGSIAVTGSAVQWLRDGLGIIEESSEVEALARDYLTIRIWCATSSASSRVPRRASRWPVRSRTTAGSTSCPPSPGSSPRTGAPTPAGPSSGSRATTPTPTSPGPRSRRSPTRAATWPRPWSRTPASNSRCSRSTAA